MGDDETAWQEFVQSETVHKGHGAEGQGSPISLIVLEHYERKFREIYESKQFALASALHPTQRSKAL